MRWSSMLIVPQKIKNKIKLLAYFFWEKENKVVTITYKYITAWWIRDPSFKTPLSEIYIFSVWQCMKKKVFWNKNTRRKIK